MKRILFPHIEKWLVLLIPFVAIGFYPGYWSEIRHMAMLAGTPKGAGIKLNLN